MAHFLPPCQLYSRETRIRQWHWDLNLLYGTPNSQLHMWVGLGSSYSFLPIKLLVTLGILI